MKTIDNALLWVTRFGVFLVPFVPLIVATSLFFPFITGKGFAFRIITEIVFGCYILLALRQPEFRPKRSYILYAVLSFLAIVFLADVLAVNPFKAFWSNFERMEGFVTMIHLGMYFLVTSSVLHGEKWWYRFFATSVGVSAFLGIYGMLQLGGKIVINQGGVRLDGTFGNAAYFAGYMLFHIFLTLFLIVRHRLPAGIKWLYGAALFLQVFALIFTATRGAGVGLIGGLSVFLLLVVFFERKNKRLRMGAAGMFVAVALVVLGLYAMRDVSFVKNNSTLTRFASISASDAGPRLMVWGMAWKGFQERPMFGWGQEGFNHVFNKYYDPGMWGQEQWFDRTHNIFFDWLIAAGSLGLLSYLSLFCFLLWYVWKGKVTDGAEPFLFVEKSVLIGLLVAYFVHNFFVFDNLISYILFFSLLAFVHMRFSTPFPLQQKLAPMRSEQATSTVGAILLVAVLGGIYFLNIRPIGVASDLIEALRPQSKGITENLGFYKKAFELETVGTQEVGEQAMQAAITVAGANNVPDSVKSEFITFGTTAMTREITRVPKDARLLMFIGGFLNRLGRYGEALPYLEKAHQVSPAKQTIAFELSNTYFSLNRVSDASTLLKAAYESAPNYGNAKIFYAVSAIRSGDSKFAEELIATMTPETAIDDRFVKAYFEVKQFAKVIELLKLRIIKNPTDVQAHISLAAAYFSNGNRKEAVAELQKTIELNPAFKEQGEHYIKEIQAGRTP